MYPLITGGIDPALTRVLEKRGGSQNHVPRRKRADTAPEKAGLEGSLDEEGAPEESGSDPPLDQPKHTFDDLA